MAAVTLLVMAGCGQDGSSATAASSPPARAALPTKQYSCAPGARTLCVMAGDNGRTFTVRTGTYFTVELRAAHRIFSVPAESGAKVLELIGSSHSGGAAAAYYRALAPGHVTLRAFERPQCTPGTACPDFILVWTVQVHVVR